MEINEKLLAFWIVASLNAQRMLNDSKLFLNYGPPDKVFIYSIMFSITYFCMCNNQDCDFFYQSFHDKMTQQNHLNVSLTSDEKDDFMQYFAQCMKLLKRCAFSADNLSGVCYYTAIIQLIEKRYPCIKMNSIQHIAAYNHVILCFKEAFSANEQLAYPFD